MNEEAPLKDKDLYDDTPEGMAKYWSVEINASKMWLEKFHTDGQAIERRYRDEREGTQEGIKRLNLYPSNVQVQEAMMYGKTPEIDVSRTFDDQEDPVARLAGIILERTLQNDCKRPIDTYARSLARALKDRRLPGLGQCRIYYVPKVKKVPAVPAKYDDASGKELAPALPESEEVERQEIEVRYVYWRDQLWSPCRMFEEMRWWAQRIPMDRVELRKRFPQVISGGSDGAAPLILGDVIPLNSKKDKEGDPNKDDPWARADIWEIHSKEKGKTYWWNEGYPAILDEKQNPLGLDGFWPFGEPMAANLHNGTTIPQPDFHLAKDPYNNVDLYTTRIFRLVNAMKVIGAADGHIATKLQEMINGEEGGVIEVENWALHAQKGGLKGRIDWLPLEQVVGAIDKLVQMRQEEMSLAYQVAGVADITRGQQTMNGTPGEAQVKARYASVRMQAMQDEFAKFATELQRLKAEVACKQFTPETFIQKSNILNTPEGKDPAQVQAAIAFLKSNYWEYRIQVKPDSLATDDFNAKQAEATEAIGALSQFLTAGAPLAQAMPDSVPFMLELLKAAMTNYRWFADKAEGIFTQAVLQAKQAAAMPKPPQGADPKLQAAQLKLVSDQTKAQADMQKEQFKLQADMQRMQMETEQKAIQEDNQARSNVAETRAKHLLTEQSRSFGRAGPPPKKGATP